MSFAPSAPFAGLAGLAGLAALVPSFGVPGVEAGIVHGLLAPPVLGAAVAAGAARRRAAGTPRHDDELIGALAAALAASAALLLGMLPRMVVDADCLDPEAGATYALAVPPGLALAAVVGLLVGRRHVEPRRAAWCAASFVLAPLLVVVYELVATPAVFVHSLFAGYYPGPIYDEDVALPSSLVAHRALLSLAFTAACALALSEGPRRVRTRAGLRALALVLVGLFAVLTGRSASFGCRVDVATIDAALGGLHASPRCVLHHPSELGAAEVRRTLAECDAHLRAQSRLVQVSLPGPVHVFLYRDAAEKGRLVGARETYVAKPWRAEVHVQREPFPHPVLGHELAHVVGGALVDNPLHVPGRLFGLLVHPGLTEGLAVALGGEGGSGLDAEQSARVLLELGALPTPETLSGLGFLGGNAHAAYTAAGVLVRDRLESAGPAGLQADLRALRLSPSESALRALHARLRAVPLPEGALERARVSLLDRGYLGTRCVRRRAHLERAESEAAGRHDLAVALRCNDAVRALDPRDPRAPARRVIALAGEGRLTDAEQALSEVPADAPAALRARLHRALADGYALAVVDGLADARRHLDAASALPTTEEAARALDARRLALDAPVAARAVLMEALAESGRHRRSGVALGASLEALANELPLAAYLLARRLEAEGAFVDALAAMDRAERAGALPSRLARELTRMRARAAVATVLAGQGERTAALAAVERLRADPGSRALDALLARLLGGR